MYSAVVYIKGMPTNITVDEYLPYVESSEEVCTTKLVNKKNVTECIKPKSLLFAQQDIGGAVWTAFYEKMFAKAMVNYESIEGGWPTEAFDFLTPAPSYTYAIGDPSTIGTDPVAIFDVI
jgi:hypothetical protein